MSEKKKKAEREHVTIQVGRDEADVLRSLQQNKVAATEKWNLALTMVGAREGIREAALIAADLDGENPSLTFSVPQED